MPRRKWKGLSLLGAILLFVAVAALVAYNTSSSFKEFTQKGLGNLETMVANPNVESVQTVIAPLLGGATATGQPAVHATPPSGVGSGQSDSWLKIYFTSPDPPDQVNNGIDQTVVAQINGAQQSIDVTSFDLNLPSVINALVAAAQRGVQVRVVYDGKNGNTTLDADRSPDGREFNGVEVLRNGGVQLVDGGRSSGLMHDKMVIIDSRLLFAGSWNLSYNDTFRNNNNLLEITDPTLIANYQAKFDEMFIDKRFGNDAEIGALEPQSNIDGVDVLNFFTPVDDAAAQLVELVDGAQHSIRFMAFTYTRDDLANAMISRFNSGVDVAGVIENRGASQGAMVPLFCAHVPVKVDGNKYTMHHKVLIVDESIVVTGSFNFTEAANSENDDNTLIIYDSGLAQRYLEEFDRVDAIAETPVDVTCP